MYTEVHLFMPALFQRPKLNLLAVPIDLARKEHKQRNRAKDADASDEQRVIFRLQNTEQQKIRNRLHRRKQQTPLKAVEDRCRIKQHNGAYAGGRNQIAQFKRKVLGYGKNQQIKQNIGDSYKKVLDRVNLNRTPQLAQKDSQKRHR